MTLAKTLLAVTIAGLGALAMTMEDAVPAGNPAQAGTHYPGIGLGTLLQPLEH